MKSISKNEALKLINDWQHLVGLPITASSEDSLITDIIIVPSDPELQIKCLGEYRESEDFESALLYTGYDPESVMVFLVCYIYPDMLYKELHEYLQLNSLS